jgi:hypothetical protein
VNVQKHRLPVADPISIREATGWGLCVCVCVCVCVRACLCRSVIETERQNHRKALNRRAAEVPPIWPEGVERGAKRRPFGGFPGGRAQGLGPHAITVGTRPGS